MRTYRAHPLDELRIIVETERQRRLGIEPPDDGQCRRVKTWWGRCIYCGARYWQQQGRPPACREKTRESPMRITGA
jgi:hypothetical protein